MSKFGNYNLVAELGQGGMADVILALSQGLVGFNKLVVLKRLRSHLADDPEFREMLVDEARLAARLRHPNIVNTNEVGEIDGRFFMAMEYLDGQPLSRVTRRAEKEQATEFDFATKVRILADVLDGLHHAHELTDFDGTPFNVVHRDVTPSNVFLTYEGVVKVVDFGIAKAAGRSSETKTGVVKGKMTYIPPEQALGADVDRRADIYSVGVMLWEAAVGSRMWKGLDDVVILGRLIRGEIPISPQCAATEVDDEIDRICRKALDPNPEKRYPSAAAFQADLEDYLKTLDDVPSNKQMGRIVASLYAKERAELKKIIDEQLAKLTESGALSLNPVVLHGRGSSALLRTELMNADDVGAASRSSAADAAGPAHTHVRAQRSWLGVAAAAAAGGGILWFMSAHKSDGELDTGEAASIVAAAPSAAPSPSSASSVSTHPLIQVTLRATPSSARFRIDGGPALESPYWGELPGDGTTRELTIEAKGYETETRTVRLSQDVVVDVTLKKSKRASGGVGARPPAQPETPAATPVAPAPAPGRHVPKVKPKPSLMEGDPWKKAQDSG